MNGLRRVHRDLIRRGLFAYSIAGLLWQALSIHDYVQALVATEEKGRVVSYAIALADTGPSPIHVADLPFYSTVLVAGLLTIAFLRSDGEGWRSASFAILAAVSPFLTHLFTGLMFLWSGAGESLTGSISMAWDLPVMETDWFDVGLIWLLAANCLAFGRGPSRGGTVDVTPSAVGQGTPA